MINSLLQDEVLLGSFAFPFRVRCVVVLVHNLFFIVLGLTIDETVRLRFFRFHTAWQSWWFNQVRLVCALVYRVSKVFLDYLQRSEDIGSLFGRLLLRWKDTSGS